MVGGPEPDYRERDARSRAGQREAEVRATLDSIEHAFDDVAPVYDRVADGTDIAAVEDDWLAADLQPRLDWHGLILDVGCGTGFLLDILDIPVERYIGVDISAGMIEQARAKHPRHRFIKGDMHRHGFIQPMSVIFLGFDVFNLSPRPAALLDSIRTRGIMPGGLIYAIVTTPAHATAECACHDYTPPGTRTFYTAEEAKALFSQYFHAVEVREMISAPEHRESYMVVTGYGRHYRDTNGERPWNGPGG
jgi:SAM-dependent methyltransferase